MHSPLEWLAARFASQYAMWGAVRSLRQIALTQAARRIHVEKWQDGCRLCRPALCCYLLEVRLSPVEADSGRYEMQKNRRPSQGGGYLARRADGSCRYLVDDLCSIYDQRPGVCRDYYCAWDPRMHLSWPG